MDNPSRSGQLHPLMIAAAISVILLSAVGIAAMTGILPRLKAPETTAVVATMPAENPVFSSITPAPAPVETAATAPAVANPEPAPAPVEHQARQHTAYTEPRSTYRETPAPAPVCYDCGTVTSVNAVAVQGKTSGVGAVGGAVAGGVVGHQFGGGKGKDAMTVLGAIGGALAGNQIEKSQRQTTRYDVMVQMEDGSSRSFSYNTIPAISSGDRVRVANGELLRD